MVFGFETGKQTMKSVMLETVHNWSNATTRKQILVLHSICYMHCKHLHLLDTEVWTTAHRSMMSLRNSVDHGWKEEDGKLLPILVLLSSARDVFKFDVKCISKNWFSSSNILRRFETPGASI